MILVEELVDHAKRILYAFLLCWRWNLLGQAIWEDGYLVVLVAEVVTRLVLGALALIKVKLSTRLGLVMYLLHISFSFCFNLVAWLLKLLLLKCLLLCLEILKLWDVEWRWHRHFDFQFCCHFDGILFELHKFVHFLLMMLMMGQLLRFSLLLLLDFRLAVFVALLDL